MITTTMTDHRSAPRWLTRLCTALFAPPVLRQAPAAGLGADDLMPELDVRVQLLRRRAGAQGVVTIARDFTPHECSACTGRRPRITSCRVWGAPRAEVVDPLQVLAVCLQCALGIPAAGHLGVDAGVIGRVRAEARPGAAIRIEVCE
jgi:hypothetical protein